MKTVDKALSVLDQFSLSQTEIGLSELSRMAGLDKAATRRLLVAMMQHGFIEQVDETRKYRLGHGFLRLARIREATVPVTRAAQDVVDWLVGQVNETAHVSLPSPAHMVSVAHHLPNRAHRINIEPGEAVMYHATSSGLAYMAFSKPETIAPLLALPRPVFAKDTITDKRALLAALDQFRALGYAHSRESYEADVASVAMPFYREAGDPTGCVALALPKADLTDARMRELLPVLRQAVARIEQALTGF